ncbi:hypothetical protein ACWKW9_12785 [Rhizobium daejeonense]
MFWRLLFPPPYARRFARVSSENPEEMCLIAQPAVQRDFTRRRIAAQPDLGMIDASVS